MVPDYLPAQKHCPPFLLLYFILLLASPGYLPRAFSALVSACHKYCLCLGS